MAIAYLFLTGALLVWIRRIEMRNGHALAAVVGGILLAVTSLAYAGNLVVPVSEDTAVNGIALLMIVAFFAVTVYEDWKDAKHARGKSRRG
jgi:hypothetical protein